MDFETRAIHAGQEPDPATGSVVVPIYQTSTYAQEAVGQNKGYDYSRVANPTRTALPALPRLARERRARRRVRLGHGRGHDDHAPRPSQRARRLGERRLRRGLPALLAGLPAEGLRHRVPVSRGDQHEPRRAPRRANAHRLARDADEPAAERHRHRGRREGRARGRRDGRRRQHVREPVPAAAARAGRGHGHALDDEVHRRALGPARRLRRDERPDDRGAPLLPAEVARRNSRPVRLLARRCAG